MESCGLKLIFTINNLAATQQCCFQFFSGQEMTVFGPTAIDSQLQMQTMQN
jgi:hypothetical protein